MAQQQRKPRSIAPKPVDAQVMQAFNFVRSAAESAPMNKQGHVTLEMALRIVADAAGIPLDLTVPPSPEAEE